MVDLRIITYNTQGLHGIQKRIDVFLTLVNLYGPNNDNPNFFQEISNCIDEIGNDEAIMCGDYNCVLNPELDYYNYKNINNTKARDKVLEIMKKNTY